MKTLATALLMAFSSSAAVSATFKCELMDGSARLVAFDLAARYPSLVRRCIQLANANQSLREDVVQTADNEGDDPSDDLLVEGPQARLPAVLGAPGIRVKLKPSANLIAIAPLVQEAAKRHGVNADLVHAVIHVESAYNPSARSPKGALGLMQVMPATAARFGTQVPSELFDPARNIDVGVRYLKWLATRFDRLELVLAAYNAGEGAVMRNGYRIPPYAETQAYVRKVTGLLERSATRPQ